MLVTRSREHFFYPNLHVSRFVVIRQRRRLFGEHSVWFQRELVARQVRRLEGERFADIAFTFGHRLRRATRSGSGQCVHQIKVHIAHRCQANFHRTLRLGAVMHATQRQQMRIVETLNTN